MTSITAVTDRVRHSALGRGGWFSCMTHWIGHEANVIGSAVSKVLGSTAVAVIAGIFVGGGAIVVGGQAAMKQN